MATEGDRRSEGGDAGPDVEAVLAGEPQAACDTGWASPEDESGLCCERPWGEYTLTAPDGRAWDLELRDALEDCVVDGEARGCFWGHGELRVQLTDESRCPCIRLSGTGCVGPGSWARLDEDECEIVLRVEALDCYDDPA